MTPPRQSRTCGICATKSRARLLNGMSKPFASLLLLAACGGDPVKHTPDAAPSIDAPADAAACATPTSTVHHAGGTITAPETWSGTALHLIDGDLLVEAPVTIERCATIQVTAGKSIELRPSGTLQPPAGDTSASEVTFRPLTTAWSRIRINGGSFLLDGASISGAGLQAPGALTLEAGTLLFQGLTISGSTGIGLDVTGGTLDGSTNLLITGGGAAPVTLPAEQVGSLPTGSYTGNAIDEIAVPTGGTVTSTQTWKNLGVPYHFTAAAYIKVAATTGVAVLTIDPGTTLAFDKGAGLEIEPMIGKTTAASGALHAVGTMNQPIVFTSAAALPAPGDWQGIYFGGLIDSQTQLSQVRIAYAGGSGGGDLASCPTPTDPGFADDAAIRFFDGPMPAASFITNTSIENSAKNGIDRSFALTQAQTPADVPDFTATNTFTNVPGCDQTHTRAFGNGCPTTPQCN